MSKVFYRVSRTTTLPRTSFSIRSLSFSTTTMELTPLPSLHISTHHIPSHRLLPNSSATSKPLLIYHSCFRPSTSITPSAIESHLSSVGVVTPQWRYTMYTTTHFHSTTHEVLVVSSGKARLLFGGEDNPHKVEVEVGRGDVVVIPAGVGHRLLEEVEGGFEMVGSYLKGAEKWDMCYGKKGEEGKVQGIRGLEWFRGDPVYGERGPVMDV